MAIIETVKKSKRGNEYQINFTELSKTIGFGLIGYLLYALLGYVGIIIALIIASLGYAYRDKIKL